MALNEVSRLVIVASDGHASRHGERELIGVALDQGDGRLVASPVIAAPNWAYALIGAVCHERAADAVDGELKVGGKTVTPEAYIGLWRDALADAVSPQEAHERFGVTVTLVARGNALGQKGMPRRTTTDPMDGFDGWMDRFAGTVRHGQDGYFELELDLREEGAYEAWKHVQTYTNHRDHDARARGEMKLVWSAPANGAQHASGAVASALPGSDVAQAPLFD